MTILQCCPVIDILKLNDNSPMLPSYIQIVLAQGSAADDGPLQLPSCCGSKSRSSKQMLSQLRNPTPCITPNLSSLYSILNQFTSYRKIFSRNISSSLTPCCTSHYIYETNTKEDANKNVSEWSFSIRISCYGHGGSWGSQIGWWKDIKCWIDLICLRF